MALKIIVLANSAKLGGAENIAKQCHRDIIKKFGGEMCRLTYLHRSDIYNFKFQRLLKLVDTFKSLILLINQLRKPYQYIIISHMHQANLISRICGILFSNVRVYNFIHSNFELKSYSLRYILTDRLIEKYIFVSHASYEAQRQYFDQNKATVIQNEVDNQRFFYNEAKRISTRQLLKIKTTERVFLIAGRLESEKKVTEIVDTWIKFKIDHKLIIVGDGSLKNKLKKRSLSFETKIQVLDTVDNIEDYYNACDVLISNSPDESFGLVILESLNCGCTVFSAAGPHTTLFLKYKKFKIYQNLTELLHLISVLGTELKYDLNYRKKYSKPGVETEATIIKAIEI